MNDTLKCKNSVDESSRFIDVGIFTFFFGGK